VPITQGLTDAQNIFLDDLWVYICLRPKRPEYFILRYEPIRMLDKVAQYIESLRGERHTVFSVPQAVVDGVEPKGIKLLHLAASSLLSRGKKLGEEAFPRVYAINPKFTLTAIGEGSSSPRRERARIDAPLQPSVTKIGPQSSPAGHAFASSFAYSHTMRGAFVVRLGPETKPAEGRFEGWVQEVDSCTELRFHSTEELLKFFGQRLSQQGLQSTRPPRLTRARKSSRKKKEQQAKLGR
jgi:hypothetical protein